jgi:hypothetical protein
MAAVLASEKRRTKCMAAVAAVATAQFSVHRHTETAAAAAVHLRADAVANDVINAAAAVDAAVTRAVDAQATIKSLEATLLTHYCESAHEHTHHCICCPQATSTATASTVATATVTTKTMVAAAVDVGATISFNALGSNDDTAVVDDVDVADEASMLTIPANATAVDVDGGGAIETSPLTIHCLRRLTAQQRRGDDDVVVTRASSAASAAALFATQRAAATAKAAATTAQTIKRIDEKTMTQAQRAIIEAEAAAADAAASASVLNYRVQPFSATTPSALSATRTSTYGNDAL